QILVMNEETVALFEEVNEEDQQDRVDIGTTCREKKKGSRLARMFRMATPHFGLYLFLFFYLLAGAWTFARLEDNADREILKNKLKSIKSVYAQIAQSLERECSSTPHYRRRLFTSLSELSSLMEGRPFLLDENLQAEDVIPPRWTKTSSILYALSILTTTGYSNSVPVTVVGQCVAIVYGLIGIPLMILAAVDIGRFLSTVVLKVYSRCSILTNRLCGPKKKAVLDTVDKVVNTKTVLRAKQSFRRQHRRVETVLAEGMEMDQLEGGEKKVSTVKSEKNVDPSDQLKTAMGETTAEEKPVVPAQRLPLIVNATILLAFCCLGGIVYIAAGGNKTFMEAFFVTFNLVANLTMSEMPNDLNHVLTLIYIFVFVTFGVAVLSMCAELAAIELKELFLKIHYFGRKINFRRQPKVDTIDEVEVKELLKIIEEIRRKYPEKETITSLDILQYMHEANELAMKTERRDTIAFIPQTMESLRFADEQDL
ncbi:hypothetical protein PMAYCL1PPCAC_24138, partial [Pristionchus mayeri]